MKLTMTEKLGEMIFSKGNEKNINGILRIKMGKWYGEQG